MAQSFSLLVSVYLSPLLDITLYTPWFISCKALSRICRHLAYLVVYLMPFSPVCKPHQERMVSSLLTVVSLVLVPVPSCYRQPKTNDSSWLEWRTWEGISAQTEKTALPEETQKAKLVYRKGFPKCSQCSSTACERFVDGAYIS